MVLVADLQRSVTNAKAQLSDISNSLIKANETVFEILKLNDKTPSELISVFNGCTYFIDFHSYMYDNNSLNKDASYVHFMERLFGYLH